MIILKINIERDSGVPIYIQIKKQIKEMLEKGVLNHGDRLPPERELSRELKVSRNRVSVAYKELENEGIILSQQGKGTFIAKGIKRVRKSDRKNKLLNIINFAMEEAIELGFSLDDFLTFAYVKAREKEEMLKKLKVAFIECNQEQLLTLIHEIDLDSNIITIPILLEELYNEADRIKETLKKVEFIVTTSFHFHKVKELTAGINKKIINMNLEPKMETIIKIAQLSSKKNIGLVCQSKKFASEVCNFLNKAGLGNISLEYNVTEGDDLAFFMAKKDILITSQHRYEEVKTKVGDYKTVISFEFTPDQGSINMLDSLLLDLRSFS